MDGNQTQVVENVSIVDTTRRLLKNRPAWMSYTKIQEDTQGRVNASWLNSFANGNSNANADKVFWLYQYLTGEKLNIRTA